MPLSAISNYPGRRAEERLPAGNHWLGIELRGKDNRDVVGARISLDVKGRTLWRFAKGGGSYASVRRPAARFWPQQDGQGQPPDSGLARRPDAALGQPGRRPLLRLTQDTAKAEERPTNKQ